MPVNLTLNGIAFANTTTPGYFQGMRVIVEVNLTVSDPTIALIDAQQGGDYTTSITPTLVQYRSATTGAVLGTGSLVSTSVKFHSLQRAYPNIGRLVSLSQGGSFYSGTALCTTFAVVGASVVADSAPGAPAVPDVGGLYARYYNNLDCVGLPVLAVKEVPAFFGRWGDPAVRPAVDSSSGFFSARWTGFIRVPTSGKWQLVVESDDGSNLWFQGQLAISAYGAPAGIRGTGWLDMQAGVNYSVWLEYVNSAPPGYAMSFQWRQQQPDGSPGPLTVVPGSAMYASLPAAPTKVITVDTRHSAKAINRY
jgi:hypothetical protein